ncbi:MAG TPA: hypothetical protein VF932_14845, partial [Anaerolineae bacterium]
LATFAAPWLELRGTFQSWRIVEWHTFWRGEGAFQLAQVVAPGYVVPVEFATEEMRSTVRNLSVLGTVLAGWHTFAMAVLLYADVRPRAQLGSRWGIGVRVAILLLIVVAVLAVFTVLLALPSSLSMKVDFRAPSDLHSDSLIWSDLAVLPVGPVLAILAVVIQVVSGWSIVVGGRWTVDREKPVS